MPRQSQHATPNGLEGYVPYETQGSQRAIPYHRPWHMAKIVIRGCDVAFSLIVIGITAHTSMLTFSSPYLLIFSAFPAVAAICWDVTEFITICARGGRKGIHPGAHVGLHLIFWLFFMTAIGFEAANLYFRDNYDDDDWFGMNIATKQNVALAFTCLLFLNHFILFVRACVETSQRNARPPIYMVPVNAPAPAQPAGSYVTYPYPPQQPQYPVHHEKEQMTGANVPDMGPDGTYYGPGSRA